MCPVGPSEKKAVSYVRSLEPHFRHRVGGGSEVSESKSLSTREGRVCCGKFLTLSSSPKWAVQSCSLVYGIEQFDVGQRTGLPCIDRGDERLLGWENAPSHPCRIVAGCALS